MLLPTNYKRRAIRSLHNAWHAKLDSKCHFLLITTDNLICESQIYPFYYFKKDLLHRLSATFTEVDIRAYNSGSYHGARKPDVIFFQPWFTTTAPQLSAMLDKVKKENPEAKIVFLDSYAPLDLRFAEVVDPYVDVYVKKQAFRDRTLYGQPTLGDTNLIDFYGKLYGIEYKKTLFPVPSGFLDKLVIGTGFDSSKRILPFVIDKSCPPEKGRSVDVHARLGGSGADWYGRMRAEASTVIASMTGLRILHDANVPYGQYIAEMKNSKICFSPFGFGEVCWRDYEAIMCGSLLIKPEMEHVETFPEIYKKFETYIPVRWDFADLPEKINYYLTHPEERSRIVQTAYHQLQKNVSSNCFLSSIETVLNKAGH